MSSSISFCWRRRRRKGSALALFQRENLISVGAEERRQGNDIFGGKRGKGAADLIAIGAWGGIWAVLGSRRRLIRFESPN